ncbi:MAG: cysteine dioxygenase [Enterobacterales bacterium]|nr:cysteine dioxygenase [Enterobacterales bacterium]
MKNNWRFDSFVYALTDLVANQDITNAEQREAFILKQGQRLLSDLILHDDWLPTEFAKSSESRYQQYLLYCDPLERFSVVSFVWAAGQQTPIHDHSVWGIIGVLRGLEICQEYSRDDQTGQLIETKRHSLKAGEIDLVSPRLGDIHRVSNGLDDANSISIHVYGANIGQVSRHTYSLSNSAITTFVSGYDNA